jgi:16S rRNA C1402 (ribose-2'-O) methylase RsmI
VSNSKFRLTKNQLEVITQEVIKQMDAQQKKRQKQENDWRLRNTKLLLENYHRLKKHCEDIDQQIQEYEHTVFILEELTLETLMKYKIKTAKMMWHFDRMLNHFERDCLNGTEEDKRRYQVIYHRYLSDNQFTVKKLCEMYQVEQGTIYRDTKLGINDISVLLFGIVALDTTGFKAR